MKDLEAEGNPTRKQVIARTFSSGKGTAGAWPADFLTRAEQGGSVDWFKVPFLGELTLSVSLWWPGTRHKQLHLGPAVLF